jgi:hypothetical protein
MKNKLTLVTALLVASMLTACEPEVGSDAWCEDMVDTPKGDWSTNDATAFAENCILKTYDE